VININFLHIATKPKKLVFTDFKVFRCIESTILMALTQRKQNYRRQG
jgi:hypothetical protein